MSDDTNTVYQLYATHYDYTEIGPIFPTREMAEEAKQKSEEEVEYLTGNIHIREATIEDEPVTFDPYF